MTARNKSINIPIPTCANIQNIKDVEYEDSIVNAEIKTKFNISKFNRPRRIAKNHVQKHLQQSEKLFIVNLFGSRDDILAAIPNCTSEYDICSRVTSDLLILPGDTPELIVDKIYTVLTICEDSLKYIKQYDCTLIINILLHGSGDSFTVYDYYNSPHYINRNDLITRISSLFNNLKLNDFLIMDTSCRRLSLITPDPLRVSQDMFDMISSPLYSIINRISQCKNDCNHIKHNGAIISFVDSMNLSYFYGYYDGDNKRYLTPTHLLIFIYYAYFHTYNSIPKCIPCLIEANKDIFNTYDLYPAITFSEFEPNLENNLDDSIFVLDDDSDFVDIYKDISNDCTDVVLDRFKIFDRSIITRYYVKDGNDISLKKHTTIDSVFKRKPTMCMNACCTLPIYL